MDTKYPEHEKLIKAKEMDATQAAHDFLNFVLGKEFWLAYCPEGSSGDWLRPAIYNIDDLLFEFFQIDRDRIDDEKRQMIEECKNVSEGGKD